MNKISSYTFALVLLVASIIFISSCSKDVIQEKESSQETKNFVNQESAVKVASLFEISKNDTRKISSASASSKKMTEVFPVTYDNSEIAYYVINYERGGFLIVSADNRISPILAYSETNSFRTNIQESNYSAGLVDWLHVQKEYVKAVRTKNIEQAPNIKEQWENPSLHLDGELEPFGEGEGPGPSPSCEDQVEEYGPLLTATWNQGCGYNDLMPAISCTTTPCFLNSRAFAGCVPIAIAEIMRFHNHPTGYNWAAMPMNTGSIATAQLIRDIWDAIPGGLKVIDCDGTGVSSSHNTADVFTGFGYSSATKGAYSFSSVMWEIKHNRPVILSGASGSNGHMWVADGAREYWQLLTDCPNASWMIFRHVHMNWGWGGFENGWYSATNFDPDIFNFNSNLQMVRNIIP